MPELGLKIILPPVYVSRLYRQRGLFTELTTEMVKEVDKRCRKIIFPAQPCCPALLTTDGRHTIEADLLPNEAWFENLKEWTWDKAVDEYIANEDPVNANMAFTSQHGHHPALRDYSEVVAMFQGDEHLGPIMAYIFELAGRATRDGECYDPRVMKLLERNNAAFFQWLRQEGEKFLPCY